MLKFITGQVCNTPTFVKRCPKEITFFNIPESFLILISILFEKNRLPSEVKKSIDLEITSSLPYIHNQSV